MDALQHLYKPNPSPIRALQTNDKQTPAHALLNDHFLFSAVWNAPRASERLPGPLRVARIRIRGAPVVPVLHHARPRSNLSTNTTT